MTKIVKSGAFNIALKSVSSFLKGAKFFIAAALAISSLALVSCDGGSDSIPTSGNSGVGAPTSILGKTLVDSFVSGDQLAFQGEVVYTFVNANTILGNGSIALDSQSWQYTANGSSARITIVNTNGTTNTIDLNFTTPTSGTSRVVAGNLLAPYPSQISRNGTFVIQ